MKLILLGTAGYHPNDHRQTACLMLPEVGVILDAGTAMYRSRRFLSTPTLDVFLTHAHLDHVIGITYLIDILRDKNVKRVTVHAEADKLAAIEEHLLAPALFPIRPPCEFQVLAPQVRLPQGGQLTHFALEHPGGAVGFRLDWPGHSLAYVTDTTARAGATYSDAIRGVDLLVHECYFPDSKAEFAVLTGHSVTTPVAQLARAVGVGRLVLVHVDPQIEEADSIQLDAARAIFPLTQLGQDMMEIDF
jgi:ribonuclease BN (tRNA processing enzyme)